MLVFVQVNAAQIVTVREIRNVVVMAVVVSAVLLYDKVNTDIFYLTAPFDASQKVCFLLQHFKLILLCNTSGDSGLEVDPKIKLFVLIIMEVL